MGKKIGEEFRNMVEELSVDKLEKLADHYFEQHAAANSGRKARGGVGVNNVDDDLMREYMEKLRIIDNTLYARGNSD